MEGKILYLVMDVDGTLTDGKIYMGNDGEMFKAFDIKDGCGIAELLPQLGITPVIITGRSSKILENRCKELRITQLFQGVQNKIEKLKALAVQAQCSLSNMAYIGDDINDLECMQEIKACGGLVGCPADAVREVREIADHICGRPGGSGAVREFIEWIRNGERC